MVVSVTKQRGAEQNNQRENPDMSLKSHPEKVEFESNNHTVQKATFSVEEAAQYIGIGKGKTYNLVKLGYIPCVKIGKSIRISKSVLESLVNSGFTA